MTEPADLPPEAAARLVWPTRLTLTGMVAERGVRAFWPLWTVLISVLAALMLGLQDMLPLEAVWGLAVASIIAALWTAVRGIQAFRWPSREEALERLDRTLSGRPIAAISDAQAVGAGDPASEAVWSVHVKRMAEKAREAKAPQPDLKLSQRDPFALRYVALLGLTVAFLFGSFLRVASVAEMTPGNQAVASGPSWEGWVEPPLYTG
ncbi:MAG: DUF4175 family protein, partial [Boseongicola sp.]|nr:DUF4175 family protein [Boseongicola sp.]